MPPSSAALPPLLAFGLPYDGLLSFGTKALRMFNYGGIAPIIFLYLIEVGYSTVEIGTLLTAIMVRDVDAGESGRGSVCGCRR